MLSLEKAKSDAAFCGAAQLAGLQGFLSTALHTYKMRRRGRGGGPEPAKPKKLEGEARTKAIKKLKGELAAVLDVAREWESHKAAPTPEDIDGILSRYR